MTTPQSGDPIGTPMRELAQRIDAHLRRFEADPAINKRSPDGFKLSPFFNARCGYNGGARIWVVYVSYQGHSTLTRTDAARYLAWLDAGNVGTHYACRGKP